MRNQLTKLVLASLLAAGCPRELVERPPDPPVNWQSLTPPPLPPVASRLTATEQERAVAKGYTAALASPGFAALGPLLDEEAHFAFAGYRDARGREKVVAAHEALLGAVEQRSFAASRVLLTDSTQVLEWSMTGVHRDTRKPVTINGLTLLWTKDDGSISDIHLYFDEAVLKAQLGAGPKALDKLHPAEPASALREVEQASSVEETTNVALVRARLQALADGTEAGYVAAVGDDFALNALELAEPAHAKGRVRGKPPARGKASELAYFRSMRATLRYLTTSVENVWGIGPLVAVEYTLVGEQLRPIGGIAPQKDPLIKLFVVDIVELRAGKLARIWRYDDPSQLLLSP